MEATVVAKDQLQLAVLRAEGTFADFQLGKDVRRAWQELQAALAEHKSLIVNDSIGYIIYPQWGLEGQGNGDNHTLWVGVQVKSFEELPKQVERVTIPSRRYVAAPCVGGKEEMYRMYGELREWAIHQGCTIDNSEGAWTVEANRLKPVNPFEMPAETIEAFDFDILYAIK